MSTASAESVIVNPRLVASPAGDPAARAAALGRWLVLLLLAGHLLLRREFAHRNVGELLSIIGISPPPFLAQAYVTEVALLALFPLAVLVFWHRAVKRTLLPPSEAMLNYGMGAGVYFAAGFLLWGAWHALSAFSSDAADKYLVIRQSVMSAYALFFIYAFLFLGDREKFIRNAVVFLVLVSLLCAAGDIFNIFKSRGSDPHYPDEPIYGQQTLPIAILALSLLIVSGPHWSIAALALIGLVVAAWRQSLRLPQSVVPISIAGAVLLYLVVGGMALLRGQDFTIKRGVLICALFGVGFLGMRWFKPLDREKKSEVQAWSLKKYDDLFDIYNRTTLPRDPKDYVTSIRAPQTVVTDPEVYKLNAVYSAAQEAGGPSVVNNIWRLLMWRRMSDQWLHGHPVYGAGVGHAWDYNQAFFHTRFHYEDDRGGLNPHNSYLNLLYRYGAVGLALLMGVIGSALYYAWRALRIRTALGDPLLEGLLLCFFYAAIFAFFTVSFEGPSYALPFWISLALVYARARQLLTIHSEGLLYA